VAPGEDELVPFILPNFDPQAEIFIFFGSAYSHLLGTAAATSSSSCFMCLQLTAAESPETENDLTNSW
jgi:hypothetical protein